MMTHKSTNHETLPLLPTTILDDSVLIHNVVVSNSISCTSLRSYHSTDIETCSCHYSSESLSSIIVDDDRLSKDVNVEQAGNNSSQVERDERKEVTYKNAGITDKGGFMIICLIVLLGDSCRGILFPTLWPLVQKLGGDLVLQGYTVAAFSFGRALAAPVFGHFNIRQGCYRPILVYALVITVAGSLLYTQVLTFQSQVLLIVSQLLLGIGSGTLGVTRGYVAHVSHKSIRTRYIAWLTALQYAGFTIMPFVGSFLLNIFPKVDNEEVIHPGVIYLQANAYTSPALVITVIALVAIFLLLRVFRDVEFEPIVDEVKKSSSGEKINPLKTSSTDKLCLGLNSVDMAVLGCMLLNVTTKGSIATLETLGIEIATSTFKLTPSIAGNVVALNGCFGVVVLFLYGYLSSYLSETRVIINGITTMLIGIMGVICFEWFGTFQNKETFYIVSMFLIYAIGYPLGHTAAIGLFSKLSRQNAQGALFGYFAASGSIARIIFPILAGYTSDVTTCDSVLEILTPILLVSALSVVVYKKELDRLSS